MHTYGAQVEIRDRSIYVDLLSLNVTQGLKGWILRPFCYTFTVQKYFQEMTDKILQSISVITSATRLKDQVILNAYTLQCNYLM